MLNKKGDKLFRFTNEFVPFFEFGDKQLDCTHLYVPFSQKWDILKFFCLSLSRSDYFNFSAMIAAAFFGMTR